MHLAAGSSAGSWEFASLPYEQGSAFRGVLCDVVQWEEGCLLCLEREILTRFRTTSLSDSLPIGGSTLGLLYPQLCVPLWVTPRETI